MRYRPHLAPAVFLGLILGVGVARFASTPENARYQLFLLLLVAAVAITTLEARAGLGRSDPRRGGGPGVSLVLLAAALLMCRAALLPTTEARGYVLAAIGWLSFVTAWRLGSSRRAIRILFLSLLLIGAVEAAYGLIQAIGGIDRIGSYTRNLGRVASGTFVNRNHFAGLLNMTLGLSVGALYAGFAARRRGGQRSSETLAWTWLVVLSCSAIGLAVFLSLSRAGSLILPVNLVFVFALLQVRSHYSANSRHHSLPARVVLVLLVSTVAVGLVYGVDSLLERFGDLEQSQRPQVYRDTLELIAEHPWAGVGPGMYGYRFREYQTVHLDRQYSQAHNDYLQTAAEWGVPLALVIWGLVLWCVVRAVRLFLSRASAWRQGIGLGVAAAGFTLMLHSFVDFNLQIPANLAYFGAVLGLGLAAEPRMALGPSGARPGSSTRQEQLVRLLFGAAVVAVLVAGVLAAWRVFPRMVAVQIASGTQAAASLERAAKWDPENPDYPYLLGRRARDLVPERDLRAARVHLERSAELAPWGWRAHWELAQLYELLGERVLAEAALLEATRLSPRDPRMQWRLANAYLREGRMEEMRVPLAAALASDSTLLRPALGLLTKSGATLETIDRVWPTDSRARLELLRGLAKVATDDRTRDAALHDFLLQEWDSILAGGEPPEIARSSFVLTYLLDQGEADRAREGWLKLTRGNGVDDGAFREGENRVWNGRFELDRTNAPLDWRIHQTRGASVSVARSEGFYESAALRIDFDGTENLDFSSVRQTVLTESSGSYELSYRTRSEGLTTDQGVFLEIYEPASRAVLLRTRPVLGTTPWAQGLEAFETGPESDRVELRVRRFRSRQIDSRLQGTFWLDNVRISNAVESATSR